jgi:hypothetical protein
MNVCTKFLVGIDNRLMELGRKNICRGFAVLYNINKQCFGSINISVLLLIFASVAGSGSHLADS